ncbi:MAG: hypothetical protein KKA64_02720 [Nanoarchaeota archaeon]|nr:hypothetical protein [Nanoarchaeota archaeon]
MGTTEIKLDEKKIKKTCRIFHVLDGSVFCSICEKQIIVKGGKCQEVNCGALDKFYLD